MLGPTTIVAGEVPRVSGTASAAAAAENRVGSRYAEGRGRSATDARARGVPARIEAGHASRRCFRPPRSARHSASALPACRADLYQLGRRVIDLERCVFNVKALG